uniref:Rhodanese domain-containing protein n=1 Tax=Panagrellus redivivus TaxID=6233 RepID=A0A7E4WAK5_PANRE
MLPLEVTERLMRITKAFGGNNLFIDRMGGWMGGRTVPLVDLGGRYAGRDTETVAFYGHREATKDTFRERFNISGFVMDCHTRDEMIMTAGQCRAAQWLQIEGYCQQENFKKYIESSSSITKKHKFYN